MVKRRRFGRGEKIKERGRQPDVGLLHLYEQKKKAARRALDKVRNDLEEVYNKLEEDGGRKVIHNLSGDRDEESKDMKGSSDYGWWQETSDREGGSIECVGRLFQRAVELGKKQQ